MTRGLLERLTGRGLKAAFPETLILGDRPVRLEVREHPTARRIVMRLAPGGGALRLTVPRRTPARTVLAFLDRHRSWAEERLSAAPGRVRIAPGMLLPVRGAPHRLVHDPACRTARFETAGGEATFRVGGELPHLARRVRDVLKREARRDLQAAVDRHAATVGLLPRSLTLKDTSSRWGSCTADRKLAFSWRIVMAPPAVLDYLAAHEVAHFREMNHAPAFWTLCRSLCPETEAGRRWLKERGSELHAFDFDP